MRSKRAFTTILALGTTLLGCAGGVSSPLSSTSRELPPGAQAPLFGDLGDHARPVATSSELAQRYFDQGLVLTYGFNHAEAARSFREAQRLDPGCAMCVWGEAYVLGPNINKPMDPADNPRAYETARRALELADTAGEADAALIRALVARYAEQAPEDRGALDRAYADAMREAAHAHPADADVQALFAEALMDTMPWDYYAEGGDPKPEAQEAIRALERAMTLVPDHPGAIHYYIHAIEASDTPELAERPADRLANLVPGAGHLVHMPSHIYLRVGRYHDASQANIRAASADESYITQCRVQGFYPAAYYPHNIDFLQASAAFEGRSALAVDTAKRLVDVLSDDMLREFPTAEEFHPRHAFALARFGRWQEILALPAPHADFRYATGAWHYARGLALAAGGDADAARAELAEVERLRDALAGSDFVFLSGASPSRLLQIGGLVLSARIDQVDGRLSGAADSLRAAVALQDGLAYTEPPPWYFPIREALGAVLLRADRAEEAEAVFRKQLDYTPDNGWSLYGLAQALRAQGRGAEAAEAEDRFRTAWQRADVALSGAVF